LHWLCRPAREAPDLLVAVPEGVERVVGSVVPAQLDAIPDKPLRFVRCSHGFNIPAMKMMRMI
jgi:hypothetical protein